MNRSHRYAVRARSLHPDFTRPGPRRHGSPRPGFTIIELIVVITVIAILAALGTMAIMKVLWRAPDAADLEEIKQLETKVNEFKAKYRGTFPPDVVKLCHFASDYDLTGNPLDAYSFAYLQRIWPKLFEFAKSPTDPDPKRRVPIPWAGFEDGVMRQLPVHPVTGKNCVILQGDQCLVFFLGGQRSRTGGNHHLRGFSESDIFPIHDPEIIFANFGGQKSKFVRVHDFPEDRLVPRPIATAPTNGAMPFLPANNPATPLVAGADQFPSLVDNYGERPGKVHKPFVYFVANEVIIGTAGTSVVDASYNPFLRKFGVWSAIGELENVQPYYENRDKNGRPAAYYNPRSFQIITAGKDGKYSPLGGRWKAGVYLDAATAPVGFEWKDNRANFYDKQLGVTP